MNVNGGKIKMISATTLFLLGFGFVFSCIKRFHPLIEIIREILLSGRSSWISELANEMFAVS